VAVAAALSDPLFVAPFGSLAHTLSLEYGNGSITKEGRDACVAAVENSGSGVRTMQFSNAIGGIWMNVELLFAEAVAKKASKLE
jgi:hypothetical protein